MEDFNMMMIHRMSTYMKPTLLESGKRGSARIDPDNIDDRAAIEMDIFVMHRGAAGEIKGIGKGR